MTNSGQMAIRLAAKSAGKDQAIRDFADMFIRAKAELHELKQTVRHVDSLTASLLILAIARGRAKYLEINGSLLGPWCAGYTRELLLQVRVEIGLDGFSKGRQTKMANHKTDQDQQKQDELQKQVEQQKQGEQQKKQGDKDAEPHPKSEGKQAAQAGPIVARTAEEIAHDERVTGKQQSGNYRLEVPGLPAIAGSDITNFEPGELNQKLQDFNVSIATDANMEEWWRQTELYKDEPTASSYKKDVTLKTLDDDGKETDSHIIKGVYPKRRLEKPNGTIEYTFAGDFVAASASTRKREDNADAPYFTKKTGAGATATADIGTRPTSPSKPSPKSETA